MAERSVQVARREALAQQQDLPRLMTPDAHGSGAHVTEEARRALAHLLEGDAELVEVERAPSLRGRMDSGRPSVPT